jgi:hypothetical protein
VSYFQKALFAVPIGSDKHDVFVEILNRGVDGEGDEMAWGKLSRKDAPVLRDRIHALLRLMVATPEFQLN